MPGWPALSSLPGKGMCRQGTRTRSCTKSVNALCSGLCDSSCPGALVAMNTPDKLRLRRNSIASNCPEKSGAIGKVEESGVRVRHPVRAIPQCASREA